MRVPCSRLLLFCFLAVGLLSSGCKSSKDQKASESLLKNPFFYKVEGPAGARGYLLGTMHMGVDAEKDLPSYVWDAANAAPVLAIEADVTDPDLAKGFMLPKGTTLRDLLGEETWKLLEERLGSAAAQMMLPMKPAAAASSLAAQGLPITMPMDLLLLTMARDSKREIAFLETAAFQLDMLDKIMDADYLTHMLTQPDTGDATKMLRLYREGDGEGLVKMMLDPDEWGEDAEKNMEMMIYQRNAAWIPKIESLLAQKGAFIAVGAAHLVGERSVVSLLEAKGYAITRVTQ